MTKIDPAGLVPDYETPTFTLTVDYDCTKYVFADMITTDVALVNTD
jgi:hypothetical protein